MNHRSLTIAAFSLLTLALFGCATTPQTIAIVPTVAVTESNVGRGIPLIINVRDQRPTRHFGTLGDTQVQLRNEQRLDAVIDQVLTQALDKQGFAKATSGDLNKLEVVLETLGYKAESATLTDTINIVAQVSVTASHNGDTLKKTYTHTMEEQVVLNPDLETNQAWLNRALSQTLNQMANDQRLLAFLAGH